MKRRYTSRPTRGMSAIGAVVGVAILLVGVSAIVREREFDIFFILWIVVGVNIVGYHIVNALSGRGPAMTIIESEHETADSRPVSVRLGELDELRTQELISESEYQTKRREILKEV